MKTTYYLLAAIAVFIVAITGSDLIARMSIAGDAFGFAFSEHLRWASLTIVGIIFLFVPFGAAALICGAVNQRARTRSAATLFFFTMGVLVYFYFAAFQTSQHAMLDHRWTAATLSIGILPFFIGLPLLIVVGIVAAIIARVDRRQNTRT